MIRSEQLGCGARLVTEPMADVRSVALGVWVGTGSRDEDDRMAGASHFLEHLLFKGTPAWTAAAIAEAVDEVGGDMNAFTTKEYTAFYVRLLGEHLPLGLEVLGAIMTDPALRPDEVEAERQVILDEILMHNDEPADLAMERCQAELFAGHTLGRDVLGSEDRVSSISRDEILAFFEEHYRCANMVISAAGDVDHDRLAAQVDERFASRDGGGSPRRQPPGAVGANDVVVARPVEQQHVVVGMRAPGRHDERRWALAVLNHVLGGGLSSRLFQEIRERRGLAYAVWSDRVHYEECGALTVGVGSAPTHAGEVLDLVHRELDRIGRDGITERELKVAKGNLRAESILSQEDSGARMSRIGSSLLLHGRVLELDEVLVRIEGVDVAQVGAVASDVVAGPRVVSTVGPVAAAVAG